MNNTKNTNTIAALILALGIFAASVVGAYTFYSVRSFDNTISSTGSAKTLVTSDTVKWNLNISRKAYEGTLKTEYANMAYDTQLVKDFLKKNGVSDEVITVSQISANEIYKYNSNGDTGPREYNLNQTIKVESSDVQAIDALSKNVDELINRGVFINGNYLEFYVSSLPELRVSLLSDAIKDAKARAEQIAESNGQSVGSLQSASSGVTQVLAPNSIDISDYGQYDTQSIEKEVMITVRATFFLK